MNFAAASISLRAGWMLLFLISLAFTVVAEPTPEQKAQLKERFDAAQEQVSAGNFEAALQEFHAILAIDPKARGSLLMSGLVHNRLYQFDQAVAFFERFLALEPDHVSGSLGALKAWQSSGQTEKAEATRKRILAFQRSGKDPRLARMLNFEREARRLADGRAISVLEMFPGESGIVWKLVLLGPDLKAIQKRLQWKQADSQQREVMGAGKDDPPLWILGETVYSEEGLAEYKVRQLHSGSLTYAQAVERGVAELLE